MEKKFFRINSPKKPNDKWFREISPYVSIVGIPLGNPDNPYLHWEELRNKEWFKRSPLWDDALTENNIIPHSKEELWWCVKMEREKRQVLLPVRDYHSQKFYRLTLGLHDELLHDYAMNLGGKMLGLAGITDSDQKSFILLNMKEEAIASAQMEGANTTRSAALSMLQTGRPAKNKSERMILGDYRAMRYLEEEGHTLPLSWELITHLHHLLMDGQIEEQKIGTLRETLNEKGEPLVIEPFHDKQEIAYICPPKEWVEQEMPRLIQFANGGIYPEDLATRFINKSFSFTGQIISHYEGFLHPLIRAMILHFWFALLHPFEDGNGRLARMLFYWCALREEYWAVRYLSISKQFKKSPVQYAKAFIYSEQDDNDLTYFVDYHLRSLELARKDFQAYIDRRVKDQERLSLPPDTGLNSRQWESLKRMMQGKDKIVTIEGYLRQHPVSEPTAMNDLKAMVQQGYLEKRKDGRRTFYYATEQAATLFRSK
jgi:Fic family protein